MHKNYLFATVSIILLFLLNSANRDVYAANTIDTTKVCNLLHKGENLQTSNPDSAIYYYQLIVSDYKANKTAIDSNNLSKSKKSFIVTTIKAINKIGNIYYYNDEYKRAELYFQQSLKIATTVKLQKQRAKALYDIGYIKYKTNNYSSAIDLFLQSYKINNNINNIHGKYKVLNALGLAESHLENYYSADTCFRQAIEMAVLLNDSMLISDIKINLGILYSEQERLEEGIKLFEEALAYYESIDNRKAVSDAMLNIGVVLKIVGENDKALPYMKASTKIEELSQVKSRLVARYYSLADLYLQMNDYENAEEFCKKTMAVANEIAAGPFVAECNFLMGKFFILDSSYSKAISSFTKAIPVAQESNNKTLLTEIDIQYAKALLQLNRFNEAQAKAAKAYKEAKELKLGSAIKDASLLLFKAHKKAGNINNALHWFEVYHNISDSINSLNRHKEIRKIEASYNYEKKEQENELLRNRASLQEQRLKNRTITLFALVLGVILSIVVIFLLISRIKYTKALNREQQLLSVKQLEELNRELDGKKRELTSKMMFLNQKNEMIGRIINQLQELQNSPEINYNEINSLVNELRTDSPQSNWKEFEAQFIQVHPGFYKRLYKRVPQLSSHEQRICAFLRMNLNTKEIAAITGRSYKSIEVTRSRIRKKLNLSRTDNLSSFLASI